MIPARSVIFIALASVLGVACNPFAKKENGAASAPATKPAEFSPDRLSAERIRVRTQAPTLDTIASYLETTCHVEAIREADLYPKVGGVVREILVEEGDRVKEGQVLARVDQVEAQITLKQSEIALEESKRSVQEAELALEDAKKRVALAQTDTTQAKRDYDRDLKLSSSQDESGLKIVAPKVLEASKLAWQRAENNFQLAEFAVRKAELTVTAAKTNEVKADWAIQLSKVRLADTEIKAPFAGVISQRNIKVGETATLQLKLFKLTDLDQLQTVFYRPQRDLKVLAKGGQEVIATSEAIASEANSHEPRAFRGRIERVAPTVDPASGSFKITASINNSEGLLRPGLLVRVRVTLGRRENAYLIPKRARLLEGDQPYVFVIRDGVTVRIPIEEGFADADRIEIRNVTSDAGKTLTLRPDDQVVIVANVDLKEGLKVTLDSSVQTGG